METTENKNQPQSATQPWEKSHKTGKVLGGMAVVAAGILFLLREMNVYYPAWLLSWQMLLIVVGFISGIKHRFQRIGWLFPFTIGLAFLVTDFYPDVINRDFIFPIALILVGLFIIFKPRRKFDRQCRDEWRRKRFMKMNPEQATYYNQNQSFTEPSTTASPIGDSAFEVNAIFGGVEKNVLSKNFQRGEINVVFGGAEINFTQADIESRARLEISAVMGGAKLILPAHWEIVPEINCVFGSVEDKRVPMPPAEASSRKLLVLTGNAFMGGIEISSF